MHQKQIKILARNIICVLNYFIELHLIHLNKIQKKNILSTIIDQSAFLINFEKKIQYLHFKKEPDAAA